MTPTLMVTSNAARTIAATDKQGRKLLLRRPTALDTLRLFKAAGPILARNEPWLAMASLASAVVEIDSLPIPAPVNEVQIEALIDRLGDDGLVAVADAIGDDGDNASSEAHLGNLPGTLS